MRVVIVYNTLIFSCNVQSIYVGLPFVFLIMLSSGAECTQIKAHSPQASSGVYVIQPPGSKTPFKVPLMPQGWHVVLSRNCLQTSLAPLITIAMQASYF